MRHIMSFNEAHQSLIGNVWYSDPNFPGSLLYVITHERVPREAITLIHRGTGESKE